MCVRQSSLGSGDESDDGDVKKKRNASKDKKERKKKHEAESRLNYHLEQYRLLFSQNGCSCSLPAKGLASAPKNLSQQALSSLYSSPSPVPAHLKSICRSMPLCNLLRHWIPAAGSLT